MKEIKDFCKELWEELNENVWGKLIILVGAVYIIGNLIIKIFELNYTIDLVFNIPLITMFFYFILRCLAETLHKEN